jgi:hypothetical protein
MPRPPLPRGRVRRSRSGAGAAVLLGAALLPSCTGATVGAGVGEARFDRAPYYAGPVAPESRTGTGATAYVPIAFQRDAEGSAGFDPGSEPGTPLDRLVEALNGYLDELAAERGLSAMSPPAGTPPDVRFGCETDGIGECVIPDEGPAYGPGRLRMRLAVGRPSGAWVQAASRTLNDAGADRILVITLETGQYWPRQTNWRGSKAVDLGTDRTVPIPWLTSLEAPVSVIQLTGALVGPDGKAIRIGAEGLQARRTPIVASGFGAQALITDEDVERLLAERVDGRPDGELVWRAALRRLVDELSGG